MSRTSIAYLQRPLLDVAGDPLRLFEVGANFTRSEMVKDPTSGLWLPGIRLEVERENKCVQSRALGTTWTQVALTSITNNGAEGLDGTDYLDGIVATAVDTQHGVTQAITMTAAEWLICGVFTVGDKDWIKLFDSTVANGYGYFDLDSVAKGTMGAGVNASWIRDLGGGRIFCGIRVTGTAAAHTCGFYAAADDNDDDFTGDASTENIWAGDLQVEAGLYPSSIIETAAAAVTRTADSAVVWEIAPTAERELTLLVPVLIPEHTPAADLKLFSIYKDGAAGTDHITAWADTAGKFKLTSACSGDSAGSLVVNKVISDGNLHWVSIHAKHGQLFGCADGVYGADLDAGIAADMDRISYEPHGGWTGGVAIWRKFKRTQPRPPQPQLVGG